MTVFPKKNYTNYDQGVVATFLNFLKFFINSQLNKNYFLLENEYYAILIKLRIIPVITNFIKCSVLMVHIDSQNRLIFLLIIPSQKGLL